MDAASAKEAKFTRRNATAILRMPYLSIALGWWNVSPGITNQMRGSGVQPGENANSRDAYVFAMTRPAKAGAILNKSGSQRTVPGNTYGRPRRTPSNAARATSSDDSLVPP